MLAGAGDRAFLAGVSGHAEQSSLFAFPKGAAEREGWCRVIV